jgi:hypothetical protein
MVSKAKVEEKDFTSKKAREVLQKEMEERMQTCKIEIAEILQKYNCILVPVVNITGNDISSSFRILPKGDLI